MISDITCDIHGSVPINYGSTTISDPVYGVSRLSHERTDPHLKDDQHIDVIAIDNLPNELPRDASIYFGRHLKKFIIPEFLKEKSDILERATLCRDGELTPAFAYLKDYAYGEG